MTVLGTPELSAEGESERKFRVPRRLLLKGIAAGMLVRAGEKILRYMDSDRLIDLPVHWRIGSDALDEEDAEYLEHHPSVILGETATWQLDSILPGASIVEADKKELLHWPPDLLVAAGMRSEDAYRRHHNALVRAREHGSSMVVTDGDFLVSVPFDVQERTLEPMNRGKLALFLGAAGVTAGSLYQLIREERRISEAKKNGMPYTPTLTAQASGELILAYNLAHWGDQAVRAVTPEQLRPAVSLTEEVIIEMYHALSGILSEKGFSFVDGITKSADASMALNARIVQEMLRQNSGLKDRLLPEGSPTPLEIFLYVGGGHKDVKDLYFSRMEYISAEIEKVADRLIGVYSQDLRIEKALTADGLKQTLDDWVFMTSRIGYPIPSFANREEFRNMPKLDLPDSPRAILYKRLLKRILEKDNEAYWTLFQRLAQEDMQFNESYRRHVAPLQERAMAHRDQAELVVPFSGWDLVFFEGIPHWISKS